MLCSILLSQENQAEILTYIRRSKNKGTLVILQKIGVCVKSKYQSRHVISNNVAFWQV